MEPENYKSVIAPRDLYYGEALNQLKDAPIPEVSFYIQDHLGNTRILYHTTFTDCNQAAVLYHLELMADYYPFGKILREYVAQGLPEKFLTTQHERDVETGLDYRGARFYDSEVGRFLGVDPLAGKYAGWSPYHYTLDNPVRFIDPDGRNVEDIIFNAIQGDGTTKEVARIETDLYDISFNIDSPEFSELSKQTGDPLTFDGSVLEDPKFNAQGVALNFSGEAAYKLGFQGEVSVMGILKGPDKGDWGIAIQLNGLVGLEGGITVSASFYQATEGDLSLKDLAGWEAGIQGDIYYMAASYFKGFEFTWSYPYTKETYAGFSIGMANGVLEIPGSGSAYIGFSTFWIKNTKSPKP